MIWASPYAPGALHPGVVPLVAPALPLWPAAAVLLGLLPAFVAPAPAVTAGTATTTMTATMPAPKEGPP